MSSSSELSEEKEHFQDFNNQIFKLHERIENINELFRTNITLLSKQVNENMQNIINENERLFQEMEAKNGVLKKELSDTLDDIKEFSNNIHKSIEILQSKKHDQALINKKMQAECDKLSEIIYLNIGGIKFASTKATLLRIPSYFESLLSSGYWKPNDKGEYFVDRDPTHFPRILNYLRDLDASRLTNGLEEHQIKEIKNEMDYYQIVLRTPTPTFPPLQFDHTKSPTVCSFFDENRTVHFKNAPSSIYGCVIGSTPVDKYTVRIGQHQFLLIGFIVNDKHFQETLTVDEFNHLPKYLLGNAYGDLRGEEFGKNKLWLRKGEAQYKDGDYLSVIKEGSVIRFERNKVDLGVAWSGVSEGPLFPFISESTGVPSCTFIENF